MIDHRVGVDGVEAAAAAVRSRAARITVVRRLDAETIAGVAEAEAAGTRVARGFDERTTLSRVKNRKKRRRGETTPMQRRRRFLRVRTRV